MLRSSASALTPSLSSCACGRFLCGSLLVSRVLGRQLIDLILSRRSPRLAWSLPSKVAMSILLALHIASITSAHFSSAPSSELEQRAAGFFKHYHDLINQGYGYRYYARLDLSVSPEQRRPWGTPIVLMEIEFDGPGGEVRKESIRLPELPAHRSWPRLRHQRQLDLAYHLKGDTRWAASYARHLCKTARVRPGDNLPSRPSDSGPSPRAGCRPWHGRTD